MAQTCFAGEVRFYFGNGATLEFSGESVVFHAAESRTTSKILLKGRVQFFVSPDTKYKGLEQYSSFKDGVWVPDASRGETFIAAIRPNDHGAGTDRYTFAVVDGVLFAIDETGEVKRIRALPDVSAFKNRSLWSTLRRLFAKPAHISNAFLTLHSRDAKILTLVEGPLVDPQDGSWNPHYFIRTFAASGNPVGAIDLFIQQISKQEPVSLKETLSLEAYVQESPMVIEGVPHMFAVLDHKGKTVGLAIPKAAARIFKLEIRKLPLSGAKLERTMQMALDHLIAEGLEDHFWVPRSSMKRMLSRLPIREFQKGVDREDFLYKRIGRLISDAVQIEKMRGAPTLGLLWPWTKPLFIDNPCNQIVDTDFKMVD